MKVRILIAVILVVAAAFIGRQMSGGRRHVTGHNNAAGREETHETYALDSRAQVEVRGINGSVEINTAETAHAGVFITRVAENEADLEQSRVIIEHEPSRLVIRGEKNGGGFWRWFRGGGNVKQQIVLTLPRHVELEMRGVNGPVRVGEVDGSVSVSGVNGRLEMAQSRGRSEVSGVNGAVNVAVSRLGSDGMEVSGVNGKVEIQLKENLNADIEVNGLNGGFALDAPNVTMQERENRSRMRARLGSGGSTININGVNGSVRFASSAPAATSALPVVAPATNAAPPPPPPAPPAPLAPHQ